MPTLLNHWRFLQGELVYDIKLGFSRVPAREFYEVAQRAAGGGRACRCLEPRFHQGRRTEPTIPEPKEAAMALTEFPDFIKEQPRGRVSLSRACAAG